MVKLYIPTISPLPFLYVRVIIPFIIPSGVQAGSKLKLERGKDNPTTTTATMDDEEIANYAEHYIDLLYSPPLVCR